MPLYYDQLNREVEIPFAPQRIISLVPSQTELLFDLGLHDRIVGITKFCIHPADKVQQVDKIGGTKQLDMQAIHHLKPDLIIANKEENEKGQVKELMARYPVWISDIKDLPAALEMINKVGEITGKQGEALQLTTEIESQFKILLPNANKLRVAYFIWRKPYMAAGADTFINNMLQLCGFQNAIYAPRYLVLSEEAIIIARPDVVLLSSEPYPFSSKHVPAFKQMLPDTRVILVDGEMFSWYGSRLKDAPAYFNTLINNLMSM